MTRNEPFHCRLRIRFPQPQLNQTATTQSTTQRFQPVVWTQPSPGTGNAQSCYSGKSIACFSRERTRCSAAH